MNKLTKLSMIAIVLLTTTLVAENNDTDEGLMTAEEQAFLDRDTARFAREAEDAKEDSASVEPNLKLKKGVYTYINQVTGHIESIDTLDITVVNNKITIDNVTANHGNCQLSSVRTSQYPKEYYYGDVIQNSFIKVVNNRATKCNILSVEVTSGSITNTYEF